MIKHIALIFLIASLFISGVLPLAKVLAEDDWYQYDYNFGIGYPGNWEDSEGHHIFDQSSGGNTYYYGWKKYLPENATVCALYCAPTTYGGPPFLNLTQMRTKMAIYNVTDNTTLATTQERNITQAQFDAGYDIPIEYNITGGNVNLTTGYYYLAFTFKFDDYVEGADRWCYDYYENSSELEVCKAEAYGDNWPSPMIWTDALHRHCSPTIVFGGYIIPEMPPPPEEYTGVFGNPVIETTKGEVPGYNREIIGTLYTLSHDDANVTCISAYLNATGTNVQAELAIYNQTYYPLVTSTEVNITSVGWYHFDVTATVLLEAGDYYICVYMRSPDNDNVGTFFYKTGDGKYKYDPSTWPDWPEPIVSPNTFAYGLSIYANYTYPPPEFEPDVGDYIFYGLLDEHTGEYLGPIDVRITYANGSYQTLTVNDTGWFNFSEVPAHFLYVLHSTVPLVLRYYEFCSLETNGTYYLYNNTMGISNIHVNIIGDTSPYPYIWLQKYVNGTLRTIERHTFTDWTNFAVLPGGIYEILLSDCPPVTTYRFYSVPMSSNPLNLTIGRGTGEPLPYEIYIPFYIPLLGKIGAILGSLGVIALVFASTKSLKDGLKAFVITLIVGMVFFIIWSVFTYLEGFT